MDDEWEAARLRHLLPQASQKQIDDLVGKLRIYWHIMPTLRQAKMVAWDMVKQYAAPFPGVDFNNSELTVIYPTGNKLRLVGADDPDSLRGPGLAGCSFDEYSQIAGRAFSEVISKALADHLGYAIFSGTIQGEDQLFRMYHAMKDTAEWYSVWQDVERSLETEAGATITAIKTAMEDERKLVLAGQMSQEEYDQEWFLSHIAAVKGAIYANEIAKAHAEGRVTSVPYEPTLPVDTDWDLGYRAATAIWFSQTTRGGEVRLIDYFEASGEGLPFYAQVLKDRGYVYGKHWAPHDIQVHELGTGHSRLETARSLGINFELTPRLQKGTRGELEEGIHAVRMLFPRCWFDETKCKAGLSALTHYRRSFNTRMEEFRTAPVEDWSNHGADAFRGLAARQGDRVMTQARVDMPESFAWA